jgi:hypothetical protein
MGINVEWDVLKDMAIGAAMIGLLAPLMAIGWWNAVSKRPAAPALVRWIWIFFGSVGGIVLAFGIAISVFHLHA